MARRAFLAGIVVLLCLPAAQADTVEIAEWRVPWEKSTPSGPFVDGSGRVWFVGQRGDYVANLVPETGRFARYDLAPGSEPHNLIVDADGMIWYASGDDRHIGQLNPATGRITRFEMPDRKARDVHTLAFDAAGDIWFTVQQGNFVGKLTVATGTLRLIEIDSRKSRPAGIVVNSRNEPWAAGFGSNLLLRADPAAMTIAEIRLPDEDARPRRLVTTRDDRVWWSDFERGYLGSYNPANGRFAEWPMPGGEDSRPFGMAVDREDRIWLVETGLTPNRFLGFDSHNEEFFSVTDIPSGGESVRHMHYFEPAGEVWFGTDSNYLGRATVHP